MTQVGRATRGLGWGGAGLCVESSVMRRWALVGESLGMGKDEEDERITEISSQIPC